jgi:APA family basic amino acid/polyamine antiporter
MTVPFKLEKSLTLRYVVVMAVASVIGSGVYKKVAPMAAELHSPGWVLLAWLVAGVITLFGALSFAEVTGMLADTGGEYVYYKKIYSRIFSYTYGWSLFSVINTASISSLAYVFAQSLNSIYPLPVLLPSMSGFNIGEVFYPFADYSIKLTAVSLILLLTWVNTRGVKTGAGMSNAILWLVFSGILLIVVFGLTSKNASIADSFSLKTTDNSAVTISAFFTAMLAAFWAYVGWNNAGYIGGEVKDATKNIPRGTAIGVFIVIGVYLLANITYLALLPINALEEINASGNQIAAIEAVKQFWGANGALFISVLILITTLGCTHANILTCARPYYAMANEGMFFPAAGKLNKASTPANALWIQGIWAVILVFSGSFDQLTDMIIFAVFIFYGSTTVGVFVLRRTMPDAPRPNKVWGYPVVPAIYVIFCLILLVNTVYTRPREAAIGVALILIGIPFYWWFRRSNK